MKVGSGGGQLLHRFIHRGASRADVAGVLLLLLLLLLLQLTNHRN